MRYERELEVALTLARRAGEIALEHQRQGLTPDTKTDLSPVTAADRDSERLISAGLAEAFPDDGLLGEEGANKPSRSGRRWIIDPIDGTREFVRGIPTWSVLIALEDLVGVAHFPATGETYWGVRGEGAWRDGERLKVSSISEPSRSVLCMNLTDLHKPEAMQWAQQFWSWRWFGGCLDAVLVASGRAEAWVEASAKPWDFAALKLIGEGAGAVFFDWDGGNSIHQGSGVLCAPGLEAEVRRFLGAR